MLLQIKTKQFHFMLYMLSNPTKHNYRRLSTYKSLSTMEKGIQFLVVQITSDCNTQKQ